MGLSPWIDSYGRRIATLTDQLEEYRLRGSYGGDLNLAEIVTLFNGAKNEIMRQQTEIAALKEALNIANLKKEPPVEVDEITDI